MRQTLQTLQLGCKASKISNNLYLKNSDLLLLCAILAHHILFIPFSCDVIYTAGKVSFQFCSFSVINLTEVHTCTLFLYNH